MLVCRKRLNIYKIPNLVKPEYADGLCAILFFGGGCLKKLYYQQGDSDVEYLQR